MKWWGWWREPCWWSAGWVRKSLLWMGHQKQDAYLGLESGMYIQALENGYECFVCYHKRNITIENASKYNKEKHHPRYHSSFISLEHFPFSQTLSKTMIKAWNYILGIHYTQCICLWTSIPNFWLFLTKLQSVCLVITSDNKLWMNA